MAHRKDGSIEDGPVFPGFEAVPPVRVAQLVIVCEQGPAGWRARLVDWENALPGPRLAVQVMAGLVTTAASRIDRILATVELVRNETWTRCLEKFGALEVVAQDLRATVDTLAVAMVVPIEIRTKLAICCRKLDYLLNEQLPDPVVPPPSMQEDLEAEATTEEEKNFFPPGR